MPIRPRDPSPSSSSTSSASSSTSSSPSSSPSSSSSLPAYELCTTRRHVQRALSILSQYPLVVLDCEGAALGNAGGALSLLCLGTPVAGPTQHIFLFDMPALAPDPRARGLLASFLERGPVQVVWDGRMDSIEIYAALGIGLTRVLDLQVAEVVARGALLGEGDAEREERLARHKFGWKFVEDNRATMRGLHVVRGLQNCIEFYHPDLRVEKDPVVVEMHQSGESHKWLERPMPDHLQSYAASDIALIAHLLSIFDTLGFFADPLGPEIMSRSARYVSRTTRVAKDDPLPPCAVLMLDALGVIRCGGSCVRCGMELPVSCFERWRAKGAEMRRVHCRLCVVLSLRAGSALDSNWISLPPIPRSSPRRRSRALKASACAFSVQQPEQVAGPFIPLMQPVYY